MKVYHQAVELIVDAPAASAKSVGTVSLPKALAAAGVPVAEIARRASRLKLPAAKGMALTSSGGDKLYIKTGLNDSEVNPWDVAHASANAMGRSAGFVEPDLLQEFAIDRNVDAAYKQGMFSGNMPSGKSAADNTGSDPDWQPSGNIVWHLGDRYSGLKTAREAVQDIDYPIRIGHLDTGYSATHPVVPDAIRNNKLQRSFVPGETVRDAHDRYVSGMLRMPGHGTGTLGILAGAVVKLTTADGTFNDYLGGAPFADIVCCRIASSVVLMKTSAFSDAVNYLTSLTLAGTPVQVISMSMGGAPARAWVEAVNAAYDAGITMVTAAGNNYNGLATQHLVYPARFGRVIAACGVTYDDMPYTSSKRGEMQGCYGPDRYMSKALAAFTPNVPWANAVTGNIGFAGAGTSCATPQIAAAAAIYYRMWHKELDALKPWQRVEAIRNALYRSARKSVADGRSYRSCFGNGVLQAAAALWIPPAASSIQTPEDSMPWFPILTTIFKTKPGRAVEMYQTELAQLVYEYKELAAIIDHDERDYQRIGVRKWQQFKDAVIAHPGASIALKKYLMQGAVTLSKSSFKPQS